MQKLYNKAYDELYKLCNEELVARSFAKIIIFLSQYPEQANYCKNQNPDSLDYIQNMAKKFSKSRSQKPSRPKTIPDTLVSTILENAYDVKKDEIKYAIDWHMKAMGAENFTGYLLESYIANVLEPKGWAWCSAPIVKSIDFIKPHDGMSKWELLQVKNRDNSENSSSSAIRNGTEIRKWFRSFSKTGKTNWENFPDIENNMLLSEEEFHKYVSRYLKT